MTNKSPYACIRVAAYVLVGVSAILLAAFSYWDVVAPAPGIEKSALVKFYPTGDPKDEALSGFVIDVDRQWVTVRLIGQRDMVVNWDEVPLYTVVDLPVVHPTPVE
jgi:hypothetical protein